MNTPWTDKVDLDSPLPEYPRPQMARRDWMSLNGRWDYAITDSSRRPKEFDGEIIVPFSPETELSGVGRTLKSGEYLWYCREVAIPAEFSGKHVLLHFGARLSNSFIVDSYAYRQIGYARYIFLLLPLLPR